MMALGHKPYHTEVERPQEINDNDVLEKDGQVAGDFELFVSDAFNFEKGPWKILRYKNGNSTLEVFTEEALGWPQDIVVLEDEKEVLVSNLTTGLITQYKLDNGELIGNFASVPGGPTRMKFGPDGLLYVLQWKGNGRVLRYRRDGTKVDEFTETGLDESIGIDWDTEGNLYISSFGKKQVRKFDKQGKDLGLFISADLTGPTDILFTAAGDLLVNDWKAGTVSRFDSAGALQGQFTAGVKQAEGLAELPSGHILVGNGAGSSIKAYDKDGNFVEDLIAPKAGELRQPNAVTVRLLDR